MRRTRILLCRKSLSILSLVVRTGRPSVKTRVWSGIIGGEAKRGQRIVRSRNGVSNVGGKSWKTKQMRERVKRLRT